eukprot:5858302-Amphidinium_carterae.1
MLLRLLTEELQAVKERIATLNFPVESERSMRMPTENEHCLKQNLQQLASVARGYEWEMVTWTIGFLSG